MEKPITAPLLTEQGIAKTSRAPFVAALLIIALGAFALVYFRAHQKLGAPGVKVVDVPLLDAKGNPKTTQSVPLPEQVLDFHSQPIPIDEGALSGLPHDTTYGFKFYSADDGFRAGAKVVLMGGDRTSIHKPEFCLPGNGWQIVKQDTDEIKIAGPHPYNLPVMKWTVEQQGRDANGRPSTVGGIYVFWFVNDREITREHSGRMLSIAKSMLTKGELERWAYISYLAMYSPGQEEATYERLKTLIAASVPQFQLVSGTVEAGK
jgi:hypothetical protein